MAAGLADKTRVTYGPLLPNLDAQAFVGGYGGVYVDHFGYASFFSATAMLGVPVLLLVWLAARIRTPAHGST